MQRPLSALLLAFPLIVAGCTTEAKPQGAAGSAGVETSRPETRTPAPAPDTDTTEAPEGADEQANAGAAAGESAAAAPDEAADAPAPAAEPAGAAAAPEREPAHDFSPGGPIPDSELGNYHVAMSCAVDGQDVGTMTIALWADGAPITVRNFLRLCDEGFYDGLTFHRILRSFMIQGGDPTGTGAGNSPYGTIQAEFSDAPERAHGYGVLSMARLGMDDNSASCQFFVCCDEGPNVWNLDGKYTSFGRITSGVATLEALANVPTASDGREASKPTQTATITRAEVREGPAPTGETIARPLPDLNGEPERIVIQHVLISFKGAPRVPATRTKEEAEALAADVLKRAQEGEDFETLVRTLSDDPVSEDDDTPGVYKLLNTGRHDFEGERAMFELQNGFNEKIQELRAKVQSGELTQQDFQTQGMALQTDAQAKARELQEALWGSRDEMVPAFGDVGFGLKVGEIGMAEWDAEKSKFGWHIIKRLE